MGFMLTNGTWSPAGGFRHHDLVERDDAPKWKSAGCFCNGDSITYNGKTHVFTVATSFDDPQKLADWVTQYGQPK